MTTADPELAGREDLVAFPAHTVPAATASRLERADRDHPLPARRAARGRGGSPRRVPAFEIACRRADRALRQALRDEAADTA